jgi:hypothetical protein
LTPSPEDEEAPSEEEIFEEEDEEGLNGELDMDIEGPSRELSPDSGSDDCEPEEYDETANIKYIQTTALLAFDLGSMMMDWDLTPGIAEAVGV